MYRTCSGFHFFSIRPHHTISGKLYVKRHLSRKPYISFPSIFLALEQCLSDNPLLDSDLFEHTHLNFQKSTLLFSLLQPYAQ